MESFKRIETKLIHAGEPKPRILGAVMMPIFQSTMYEYAGEGDIGEIKYIRLNNTPNHEALHEKLKSLENAEAALVTASGMAAISTTLLTFLSSGDHLLAQEGLYGGTHSFLTEDLPSWGIKVDFFNGDDPSSWEEKCQENTRAIFLETMTNPLLQVADLKAISEFCQRWGILSIIDNTLASPVNFRPPEWGFDLSVHSCTKYLNGHSDIVAGAVIGRKDLVEQVKRKLNHLGGSLDPHAAFLLHRGIKTLALRMKWQNESARKIAQFLENHPAVDHIHYPGLEGDPYYQRARELLDGTSGVLSFELKGGLQAAKQMIQKMKLPIQAPSLGGIETLITRPATTSHSGVPPQDRKRMGISDSLIRLSVGVEATEEIIEDFEQALQGL